MLEEIKKAMLQTSLIGTTSLFSKQLNPKRLSRLKLRINANREEDDSEKDSWVEDHFILTDFHDCSVEYVVGSMMTFGSYLDELMTVAENKLIERAVKLRRQPSVCSDLTKRQVKKFILDALRDIHYRTDDYGRYVREIERYNSSPNGSRKKWLRIYIDLNLNLLAGNKTRIDIRSGIVYSIPDETYNRKVTLIKKFIKKG